MIDPDIRREIGQTLAGIEQEENVRILYACESGSRAWGFPSQDSDYDVRFLYVHSRDWYLSIDLEFRRDVIERPISDQLDVGGWDLRKALGLFRKSNPPLFEWLSSPIVYNEPTPVAGWLRDLLPEFYSPVASIYHYLNMARKNHREYLKGDIVRVEKYFYVLRPLLAVKWIEESRGVVPMEFDTLVEALVVDPGLRDAIDDLLKRKKSGEELDSGPKIPAISEFIEREIERLDAGVAAQVTPKPDIEKLNELFRRALDEVW